MVVAEGYCLAAVDVAAYEQNGCLPHHQSSVAEAEAWIPAGKIPDGVVDAGVVAEIEIVSNEAL